MRSLHVPVCLFWLASACAVPVVVSSPGGSTPSRGTPIPVNAESATAEVVRLTNQYRLKQGQRELAVSARLTEAARLHAEQMAAYTQLAHNISAARYPMLQSRLDAVGYAYVTAGENIAWNQPDADAVMNTWLNSTGHRANILNSEVTEIGVAVARSSNGEPYWIQVFGRPR
jgi:uncharacterized protein YkwD